MGRPPVTLAPDQVREVETLAALLNQDQIADYLGICRNTFRAICGRDAEVAARYKRGKARAIAHVANGLLQKARAGETTAIIFYLKTQAGWREVAKPDQAETRREDEPDLSAMTDAELCDRLEVTQALIQDTLKDWRPTADAAQAVTDRRS